ncbi:AsmA-like C-terminal region-containing protein [Maribacter luteus]|uniref:AsmA-like C-terminal region-containing protein n=1 Tax=Maribacter luteus TaxID=2594478 RepID=UPI0024938D95|nr:AsmA-like C-terminal region-containing protein [Maribacter luteus]
MKKKILKIVGVVVFLFVGVLIAAPFILEAKIGDILKNNVNNNVNATLDFSEAKLSLIKSFPSAEVSLKGVSFMNKAPFEGDTLFAAKEVGLKMGIGQLFKNQGEAIAIKSLTVDGAFLNIKVNEAGEASYDVGKSEEGDASEGSATDGFTLDLQSYEITDTRIVYDDLAAGMTLVLSNLQHKGSGDLSLAKSEFDTTTEALVSFSMDSTKYLNDNTIKLDALIGVDLEENKYSFLKNEAVVNQLPLVFDGFVKINEDNQEVDINFNAPSSDFKNFLALIPEAYSKDIENVTTTGECSVSGEFKGIVDNDHIPTFKIAIASDNASFKYPDLPKTVKNIQLNIALNNATGLTKDTYVDIKKASFTIDGDKFNLSSKITDLLGNTKVNAHLDGIMDLANISQAYPLPDGMDLSGKLNADVTTAFDMASIENERYENTKTSGKMQLTGFEYSSPELKNPVRLKTTSMTFNPSTVTLNELDGTTGQTDFKAKGTIDNLLGFMFNDEKVEGKFDLSSNTFAVNDFMSSEDVVATDENPNPEEQLKIPSFLDCTINASAATVIYDNLTLKDVKGNLRIVDEKAVLSNMTSSLFNGKVSFDGEVSTKNEAPTFAMKLGMDQLGIGESFKSLELFKVLAPIASAIQGKLNSDISLSGNLNSDFTPDLTTITGNMLAELLSPEVNTSQAKVLSALDSKFNFIDMDKLDLKGLKTALSFENGIVKVKPFTIAYQDIAINIDGSHTFDKKLNYTATLDVPAKYLGNEVNSLIAKIDDKELDNLTIPVTASIGGNYTSPEVNTDLTSGVKSLTTKLIDIQKQKLLNQGKDKANELIGNILGGNSKETDSTSTSQDNTKEAVKGVLGNILGGSKTSQKDSVVQESDTTTTTPAKTTVKEATKNILGGLLSGKKKKETEAEKDSVN